MPVTMQEKYIYIESTWQTGTQSSGLLQASHENTDK